MKSKGPEQWRAVVLRDEAERLAIACRQLEHRLGWFEGRGCGCTEEEVVPGCAVHYTPAVGVVEVEVLPTLRGGEVRRVTGVADPRRRLAVRR